MKKYRKNVLKSRNGITLIALVVTIIVLLILAGISISMLSGDNGILQKAADAKTQTEIGQEKEIIALAYNSALAKKVSNGDSTAVTATDLNTELTNQGATASGHASIIITFENGNIYSIDNNGKIEEYTPPSVEDIVKIGDYIEYDPIHLDAGKTQNVDSNLLTYTSLTGSATEHGNGYESNESNKGQKYTAKSGLKWRVLSISNGTIEIIPSEVIKKDDESQNNGYFGFTGARGYLYAEQELNEICKIYGYGYGADTSQITSFKIGGPYPEEKTIRSISGSGARSITMEDINKAAKVGETKDGVNVTTEYSELDSNYGSTSNPPANSKIFYPTINTSLGNSQTGRSNSVGVDSLKHTFYVLPKSKIINTELQSMLCGKYYWIASRATYPGYVSTQWHIFVEIGNQFQPYAMLQGSDSNIQEFTTTSFGILPIVTLKTNVIDTSNIADSTGKEENAWKLK